MRDRPLDTLAVVAFGFIGAAAQVGAIVALLGFLRAMSSAGAGGKIQWFGLQLSGLGGLMLASSVLGVMLAVAAGCNYLSVRRARAIGRSCAEKSVVSLLDLIQRSESLPEGMDSSSLMAMGSRGSRLTGISVENAIKLIHPAAQVVVLVGSLFWLDAWATALFLPAMLIPLPVLWRFNSRVRESSNEFYNEAARGFGRAVSRAVNTLQHTRVENESIGQATLETYLGSPEVGRYYETYDEIHLTASRATLITSLFRPLLLVYVLFLVGLQTTRGLATWESAIAYLLVMIQMLARSEGLVTQFSVISRLYTQVQPFVRFAEHVHLRPWDPSRSADDASAGIGLSAGGVSIRCAPGRPAQVFGVPAGGRMQIAAFIDAMASSVTDGHDRLRSAAFVGRRYLPRGSDGAALITGESDPRDESLGRVRALAGDLGAGAEIEGCLGGGIDDETWNALSPAGRVVVQIGPALCSRSGVILLDIGLLNALERSCCEALLAGMIDRTVLILAPEYRSACGFSESVIVLEDGRVVWVGSRSDWGESELRERLTSGPISTPSVETESDEYEDELA